MLLVSQELIERRKNFADLLADRGSVHTFSVSATLGQCCGNQLCAWRAWQAVVMRCVCAMPFAGGWSDGYDPDRTRQVCRFQISVVDR